MNNIRAHPPARANPPPRARPALAMLVVAVGFAAVLSFPYLSLNMADSRLEVGDRLQYTALVAHIFTAAIALVLGPLQFVPQIRRRRRAHRVIGRSYLFAGVFPSAVAGIPAALMSGRLITQIGLTTAATLWIITGVLAFRAARRRDFATHQAWVMRNYALTFLAVTARVLVPLLLLGRSALTGSDPGSIRDLAPAMIPIGQTLGWIVNLIIVELLIRRRVGRSSAAQSGATA